MNAAELYKELGILTKDKGRWKEISFPVLLYSRDQCQPFGIYVEGKMIGYVMVIYDYDIPEYDIWHMMIDESAQGHGYGIAALDRVIEYIRTKPFEHQTELR